MEFPKEVNELIVVLNRINQQRIELNFEVFFDNLDYFQVRNEGRGIQVAEILM